MLYNHHNHRSSGRSGVPASAGTEPSFISRFFEGRRSVSRGLSVWGLGAALGLLSFPLRARSDEPDPELADELCPADPLLEACDSPSASAATPPAAASAREPDPALLAVLGGDVRLDGLPVLPDLSEAPADLVLSQAPGDAASGGLFGLSWPVLALAGGGGLVAVAVVASGGSDSDDSDGGATMPGPDSNNGNGGGPGPNGGGPGGTDSNNPPVTTTLAETSLTVDEAAAETWDVSEWFSDPDGDDLTYTISGNPTWLELDDSKGELTIEEDATDADDIDSHVFTVVASDDDETAPLTATLTVTLTVENVNAAPTIVTGSMGAPTATVTAMEGGTAQVFTVSGWFTDPDGDALTLALGEDGPDWATINTAMGVLSLAFDETDDADVGTHALEVIATDSGDESITHTLAITVSNVNDAPVAASGAPGMLTAMEGLAAMWTVSDWFTDSDAGDTLTYTATSLPAWLGLNAMGTLTIEAGATDDAQLGMHALEVTASDKAGAMVVHTATLEITDTENEPTLSNQALTNPRIAPATGGMIVLDLANFFTDDDEAGEDADAALTFEVSSSVDDDADTNIITTELTGTMLTLTPGEGIGPSGGFGQQEQQETVSITATDAEGGRRTVSFTVTTRPNVLDTSVLDPTHGFIIQGDAADDMLGFLVSGAGDVNGDGLADLITGAYGGDDGSARAGEAYIIYGKAGSDGMQFGTLESEGTRRVVNTTNLAPADGFIIQGDEVIDQLGISVSGAGDVNGDGLDDLIAGANAGDDGGTRAGEAYIVYGKAGNGTQFGTAETGGTRRVVDTTSLTLADGFILQGDMAGDQLGFSVSGAGDVNGDGFDDLVVGASNGDDGDTNAGEAYIVYGKTGTGSQFGSAVIADGETRQVLDTSMLAPAAGFIIQGDMSDDRLGVSVSGAGDVNGDGLADLIVGAYQGDDGGDNAGEVYIIYGKVNPAVGDPGTQFGMEVTTNGVVRQVLDTTNLSVTDGFILQGDVAADRLGKSVSGAGDINGDGYDDLIVGANLGDDGGGNAGEAYIIYGKANPADVSAAGTQFGTMVGSRQVLDTTNFAPAAGFIIQGDSADDNLGGSVSGAGDVNGDGLADLIAGAYLSNDGGMESGEAYIIYGKAGTDGTQFGMAVTESGETRQVLDTTGLAPTDGFILRGDAANDRLGESVSGAGDVNGDGFDDLITGAPQGQDGGFLAGEAYVVYGGTHLGEVTTQDQTLVGMASESFLHGGAGDDRLEGHADTTVFYGGAGDDTLVLVDYSFRRVDGGSGSDTLVLGSGVELDFTLAKVRGKVRGIETLSLSDATAMVTLDQASVYALVESRDNGGTLTDAGEVLLRLRGLSGMVVLEGDWMDPDATGTAGLYKQGSALLLVDSGLDVA